MGSGKTDSSSGINCDSFKRVVNPILCLVIQFWAMKHNEKTAGISGKVFPPIEN